MSISAEMVKDLREKSGAGIMECKEALKETNGNIEEAIVCLRKKGIAGAAKKAGRSTSEGSVASYIHQGGKVGVLIEVNCETDFVAKTDDFQGFLNDLAMHIAASSPLYVKRDEVPEELINKEREIYVHQAKESGKPDNIVQKMVDGKIDKYLNQICLTEQAYVKDQDISIDELVKRYIAKLGENISINRFARFAIGE
ncbi:MAG: translation elongation factor Ts [Nitrospinota bacterium]|nr:translation elongation factor Ts [Nitrospinota bacterium]